MAFFGLPEGQKYLEGGLHEQEDVAVYTWGEESYDGLGDALLEGGDDFNDETFGGSGPVGMAEHPICLLSSAVTATSQGRTLILNLSCSISTNPPPFRHSPTLITTLGQVARNFVGIQLCPPVIDE